MILVPGDLVVLDAGAQIPADLRLVDAGGIRTGEATLTGESAPVEKQAAALADADLPLGDRSNMAFKGTTVTYGHGRGIAVATGMATELGKVAGLLGEGEEPRTPLQERLGEFGKRLAVVVFAICAIIFVAGLVRGEDTALMFLTAVSLAVAAIPEALPATVTISLAIGARKMAERNALVRRLAAVETLGSVTFICSDKTGTLTRNEMQVDAVVIADAGGRPIPRQNEPADALFAAIALNNHAHRAEDGNWVGDPTEVALKQAAAAYGGLPHLPRRAEFAFDSERKRMTTVHPDGAGSVAYVKGAPEYTPAEVLTPSSKAAGRRTEVR